MDLNNHISHSLGVRRREGILLGVELEYERSHLTRWKGGALKWMTKPEASLRQGGVELVSPPIALQRLPEYNEQLQELIKQCGMQATSRCGMHTHVNMSDRTWLDLWNVNTLYAVVEPYIFAHFAPGREHSHFCVPLWANTAFVELYLDSIRLLRNGPHDDETPPEEPDEPENMEDFIARRVRARARGDLPILHAPKYCAVNLRRLKDLGTIEYRQPPSTESVERVQEWCEFLVNMHESAYEYGDPLDIIEAVDEYGQETMAEQLGLDINEVEELDLEDAMDAAVLMAGNVPKDWKELDWKMEVA